MTSYQHVGQIVIYFTINMTSYQHVGQIVTYFTVKPDLTLWSCLHNFRQDRAERRSLLLIACLPSRTRTSSMSWRTARWLSQGGIRTSWSARELTTTLSCCRRLLKRMMVWSLFTEFILNTVESQPAVWMNLVILTCWAPQHFTQSINRDWC